ncbi:MAG TPA: MMPL family transporter, partial [Burkholderiaceae bacterium]|nr:MMPL family transporter [Burkholderiaceae bacterium]
MNLPTSSRPTWRGRVMALVAWAAFIALGVLAITRASFESDFSAFLPRDPTPEQRLLVEQLRDGAASKLVLVALEGADAATRAQWSSRLAERLRREESTAFAAVENGAHDGAGDRYARLFEHRYLLSPSVDATRFTVDGLRAAINDTIALLGSPAGALIKPVILRDPTGEIIELASTFAARAEQGPRMQHGVWSSRDGQRALLLATTHAPGSDIDAQQAALARLHAHFDAVTRESPAPAGTAAGRLVATGPGVFAVLARERIKNDASRLSVIGSVLVAVILLAAFRSVPALILGAVPVATGVVAGIAAVALGFGTVYGLTVGFGITLIGEAIDYGIYFLVQSRGDDARTWFARFWPTVRLGLMTSLCGFAVLLLSGFPGLAQLGLFSCAGLIAAAWATRYVLPHLTPERLRLRASPRFARAADALVEHAPRTRWIAAALVLAAVAVIAYRYDGLWSRDLASLSPVSAAEQALDAQLRGDLGAPDVRHIIVIDAPDDEAALETAEHVGARLDAFVARGALAGYDSPARWLPSAHTQLARRDALPEPTVLRDRLAQATADLPISATRLQPFVEDVARARAAAPLS